MQHSNVILDVSRVTKGTRTSSPARWYTSVRSWFSMASPLRDRLGAQESIAATPLIANQTPVSDEIALQLDAVWSCVDRRGSVIGSLPWFVYESNQQGERQLARGSILYDVLHDSPNARMTPSDFWRAVILNYDLRGNAYIRIDRNSNDEPISLWPLPAGQVKPEVLFDGSMIYVYEIENEKHVYSERNIIHLRNLGNGTIGLDKLEFMRAGLREIAAQQSSASAMWSNSGKPTGVLTIDKVLTPEQRNAVRGRFTGMAEGDQSRLYVLEADMKYQQVSLTPEQQQLLESRSYSVETICRWFDVPPVLIHHSNVTTWGSGIEQIIDGWYKLSIGPLLKLIEQALNKKLFSVEQRTRKKIEAELNALLRGNPAERAAHYATMTQNGIMTRNEARQLENLPPVAGGDALTVQSNLLPIQLLGANIRGGPNAAQ